MTVGSEALLLDPQIRDWVVLPLVYMMVLTGALRHYCQEMLVGEKPIDKEEQRYKNTLTRVYRFRLNCGYLNREAFLRRRAYYIAPETGLLHGKVKGAANPMANPMGMVDMMKGNVTFVISNIIMMTFISAFFSGFVVVKVPFPLTVHFKVMLQQGIDLSTLDASYVSSLSWYFLVMFGLRPFLALFLGDGSGDAEDKALQMQMGMGMGAPMGFDASKAYKMEAESLELVQHKYELDDVEKRVLGPAYARIRVGAH